MVESENYANKYRKSLYLFVKDSEYNGTKTLQSLVEYASKRMAEELEKDPMNMKKFIYSFILRASIYFLEGNELIEDFYFCFNENRIYQAFDELLNNPTEEQLEKFRISFEKLEFCADIIFLVCEEIFIKMKYYVIYAVEMFLRIAIKKYYHQLSNVFKSPIKKNRNELLFILSTFFKIKYNKNDVTRMELLNLFKEEEDKKVPLPAMSMQTKQRKKRHKNKSKNIKNSNKDDNTLEKEKNSINNNNKEIPPQNESSINEKDNNEMINNNIQINDVKNLEEENEDNKIQYRKFLQYLQQKKEYYTILKYDPPVLNYLIKNRGKIDIKYFMYENRKDSFIDHLYDNLSIFLLLLSIDKIDFQEGKHGYFCDKVNDEYVEGLYSYIDLKLLNEKITTNINFPKDDFKSPDEKIAKNAFKSRALSFEYYINDIILHNGSMTKIKERPRVIYFFKNIDEIKNNDMGKENDIIIDNSNKEKSHENSIIEVDSVILEKEEFNMNLDEKLFILDDCFNFGIFEDEKKAKLIENYTEPIKEQNILYNFSLKPNTLCVIEMENHFPQSDLIDKNKQDYNQGISFKSMVRGLIKKSLVLKTLYEQLSNQIEKIKLVLFYNAVHKYNYEEELRKAFIEELGVNDRKLVEMFKFQCIYIKPSYLSGAVSIQNNEINILKKKIDNMEKIINELNQEIEKLKNK